MPRPREGPPGTPPGVVTLRTSPALCAGQDTWNTQELTEVSSWEFWKDNTSGGSARSPQTQQNFKEPFFLSCVMPTAWGQVQ